MNYRETSDIWRLYRREWVILHTTDTIQDDDLLKVFKMAKAWAEEHLMERARLQDIRVEVNTDGNGMFWAYVKLYKDNLKGEFKHVEMAQFYAVTMGYEEYTIVPRNSKSDHNIRNYGVVKL